MTRDANTLTDRAAGRTGRTAVAAAESASVSSGDLRSLVMALERIGYPRLDLLSAAGLAPDALDDPDTRLPCQLYERIITRAMTIRPLRNLGTRVAEATPIGTYPLLDYLVLTCDSVGFGFSQLARYFRLVGTTKFEFIEEHDGVRVVFSTQLAQWGIEFTIALAIFHFREETSGAFRVTRVGFTFQPDDVADLERAYGCPVEARAASNYILMPHEAWQLPLRRRDPQLRGVLEQHPSATAADGSADTDVVSDVRRALATRVSGGDTRIDIVARDLAMAPRTLQRKLAEAGATYHSLVEAARKAAAARHLVDRQFSICEVAYLLGYSEPAAFHRAFKRWHGTTPQAFRRSAAV